jgi:magnesium-transporting ATPase (P-type)
MDSVAALALNAEPPADGLLMRPPHVRGESLLTADMKKTIVAGVTYQLVVLLGMLIVDMGDTELHFTLVFHTFVLMQLVHEFCCRSLSMREKNPCGGIWKNPTLLCVVLLSLLGQLCVIHLGG